MEKTTLHVEGMSCQHCVMSVKKAVEGLAGIKTAAVDLSKKTVDVEYDPAKSSLDKIREAITAQGFEVLA